MTAVRGEHGSYTEGSLERALFMLSIPIVLEMSMEALFAICDAYFVSLLGNEEYLAAIGLTETSLFVVMSLALGVSMAATAMVARRTGEDQPEAASDAAFQAILIALFFSLIIGVSGYYYASDLLRLLGGSEKLVEEGTPYTRIMLTFNVVLMLLFAINAIFRGAGDAAIAMRTLILANGINIILDPCLIFGLGPFPELGFRGAAIATYVTGGSAGQHLLTSASWLLMVSIVATFGSKVLAAYTISFRVIAFTILPSWGVAMAAATLVGQNLGANQPDRAEQTVWKASFYNMILLLIISIIFIIIAPTVIRVFSDDPVVIKHGVLALRIVFAGYVFYAYEMVIGQSFNGAGDTYTPTILNFIAFWIIQIPLAYYLSHHTSLGSTGIFVAIAVSSSILALMAVHVFRWGRWKKVNI